MADHRKVFGGTSGFDRFHAPAWVSSTDPASDPTNDVQKESWWLDTTGGATLDAGAILKRRNTANSAWVTVVDLATALAAKQGLDAELTAIAGLVSAANKLIRFTGSGAADLLDFSTDATMAANSDTVLPSQKAIRSYIASVITGGASNVMIFQGVIDCSANPNYPAADAGDVYKVSVAGKIGGASGMPVEAGDTLYCITDSTASGTQAGVGANWVIVQENIDGAVIGPSSAVDLRIALFDGTTGKLIKDSGKLIADLILAATLTTKGDIYVATGAGTVVRKAAGADGKVLTADSTKSDGLDWTSPGGGASALDDLTDVDTTGASDQKVLSYDAGSSLWKPRTVSGSGGILPGWVIDSPDTPPASPNAADDEFGGSDYPSETALDTAGTRFGSATAWAWRNQGSATAVLSKGWMILTAPASGSASLRIVEQALPGGTTWTYRAKLSALAPQSNFWQGGMCVVDSSSGKVVQLAINEIGSIRVDRWTNVTTYNDSPATFSSSAPRVFYAEIERNGSNLFFRMSSTGHDGTFALLYTSSGYLTADKIGFVADSNGNGAGVVTVVDWMRRIA